MLSHAGMAAAIRMAFYCRGMYFGLLFQGAS
jgi:hypothetical protein